MIEWLALRIGRKYAMQVGFGLMALVLLGFVLTVSRCGRVDSAAEQARQTTRSGAAMASAGAGAVSTVATNAASAAVIDDQTRQTNERIDHAATPDDLRNAVLDGVCGRQSHRNDPACRVRRSNPGRLDDAR